MHHRVRTHQWVDGVLSWKDIWFATVEDAKQFVEEVICDTWKIFDCDDVVVDNGEGRHEHHEHHHHHHGHDHHHHHHHHGYCY